MQTPMEKINQRRRQLHVHSILYYVLDQPIITDAAFDKWANELVALHKKYPDLVKKGYLHDWFHDWTGDTGMHLPRTPEAVSTARWLLDDVERRRKNNETLGANVRWAGDASHKV